MTSEFIELRAQIMANQWSVGVSDRIFGANMTIGHCIRLWLFRRLHLDFCNLPFDDLIDDIYDAGSGSIRDGCDFSPGMYVPIHPSVYSYLDVYIGIITASESPSVESYPVPNGVLSKEALHDYYRELIRHFVVAARSIPEAAKCYIARVHLANAVNANAAIPNWHGYPPVFPLHAHTEATAMSSMNLNEHAVCVFVRNLYRGIGAPRYYIPDVSECYAASRLIRLYRNVRSMRLSLESINQLAVSSEQAGIHVYITNNYGTESLTRSLEHRKFLLRHELLILSGELTRCFDNAYAKWSHIARSVRNTQDMHWAVSFLSMQPNASLVAPVPVPVLVPVPASSSAAASVSSSAPASAPAPSAQPAFATIILRSGKPLLGLPSIRSVTFRAD